MTATRTSSRGVRGRVTQETVQVRPRIVRWLASTDHKTIGLSYMITAFGFFLFGGVLALFIRAELYEPGRQVVSPATFNELFTMHGT